MPIYSEYLTDTVREAYDRFYKDQEILDLSNEMSLLKAHLADQLRTPAEKGQLAAVKDTISEIRKMSNTVAKNMEHAKGYLPVSFLPLMIRQIVEILAREIKDEDVIGRIRTALGRIAIPADSREARRAEQKLLDAEGSGPAGVDA